MSSFQRITIAQAKELMEEKTPLIIDVRDAHSFQSGAIPGAQWVSYDNFRGFRQQADKDRAVIIYCYHGNASQDMAQMFVDFGFSEVYSMDGGYEAWRQQS